MNDMPRWMQVAYNEMNDGIPEEPRGDNKGPRIDAYIKATGAGRPGDPYCALGVNYCFETVGIPGTRSAAARSFEWDGGKKFVKLKGPAFGAVTVFWRGTPKKGTGHVGFYVGETPHHVYTLGFNQDNGCNESPFPKQGRTFGLIGYYWPKGEPLPHIGAITYDEDRAPTEVSAV